MSLLHREGNKIITIFTTFFLALSLLSCFVLSLPVYFIIQALLLVPVILIFRFFRKPNRTFTQKTDSIFAPADGTIVAIETVEENEYFKDKRIQVSIFMSIHNIHINWYPISGIIKYFKYHKGAYLVARHPKSSCLNEHSSIVIENDNREILVRQIAGFVARRIVSYAEVGNSVQSSQELGFIKFGSRLDVFLPLNSNILVELGEKTSGGVTEIATWKE